MKLLRAAIAGMAILATPSLGYAADLPRAAPVYTPAVVPFYNWTGFYLGGNIGYAWRNTEITGIFGANLGDLSNDRFMFGGQMGYNWQFNQFVLGVEWDFDWADGEKATPFVTTANLGLVQGRVDSSWVTTLAARFGYAADRWLFYTKLGAGWTKTNVSLQSPVLGVLATNDKSNVGWLVGFGVEYAFAPNWTAKIEYNYLGLSDTTVPVVANLATFSHDLQTLKIGANYKF